MIVLFEFPSNETKIRAGMGSKIQLRTVGQHVVLESPPGYAYGPIELTFKATKIIKYENGRFSYIKRRNGDPDTPVTPDDVELFVLQVLDKSTHWSNYGNTS